MVFSESPALGNKVPVDKCVNDDFVDLFINFFSFSEPCFISDHIDYN